MKKRKNLAMTAGDIDIDSILEERRLKKIFDKVWKDHKKPPVEPTKKPIGKLLKNNAWRGKRCFIIAGGPSVKDVNLSLLDNELTIGINRVYETFTPTILFAMDGGFQDSILLGRYGKNALKRYNEYQGLKLWIDTRNVGVKDCYFIRSIGRWGLTHKIEHGLFHGNNAGFGALNLAYVLGANPIYLIGYDLKTKDGESHYHDGHYNKRGERKIMTNQSMASFFKAHEESAPIFRGAGVEVINLNRDSALKVYPFGDIPKDLIKKHTPLYVSFYTKGGVYERDVLRLKESIWSYSLKSDIQGIDGSKKWIDNIKKKPYYIKDMLRKHKGNPIVWIDADAEIKENPELFNNITEDFGCYLRPRHNRKTDKHLKEMLSGTLYFKNNKRSMDLVNLWIQETENNPDMIDQRSLGLAFDKWIKDSRNKYLSFSPEYCCIFDGWEKKGGVVPIIEHYQTSREVKFHGGKA